MKLNYRINPFILIVTVLATINTGCQKYLYENKIKPEILLQNGDPLLSSNEIRFNKDTVYVLAANLSRTNGQKLIIEAGTLVKVKDKLSITINPGATIEAEGTEDAPIIFTTAFPAAGAGAVGNDGSGNHYWYGLRIIGNPSGQPAISSGKLKYVRIEFAGGDEFFLGLSSLYLKNVSNLTKIDHIQVSYSFSTDSYQFEGGNCNASHLISYACTGNDFSIQNGYTGKLQFLLAYRHPFYPVSQVGFNLVGMIITGSNSFPSISNLTVTGPHIQSGTSFAYTTRQPAASLLISAGAHTRIANSALMGFPSGGFFLNDKTSGTYFQKLESYFINSIVHSSDTAKAFTLLNYPPFTSADLKDFLLESRFKNRFITNWETLQLKDVFNYDKNPDPTPTTGSPLLSGSEFTQAPFNDPFFVQVPYIGALGSESWIQKWTNFIPLQTAYNR